MGKNVAYVYVHIKNDSPKNIITFAKRMEDNNSPIVVQVEQLTIDDVFKKYNQIYLSEGGLFKDFSFCQTN